MEEKKLYRELARLLAQKKINRLLAIGERLCANESLIAQHMKADMHFFHSTEAFISLFPQLSFRDETILLKGARVFQFEKIDHLLAQQAHQTILEIDLNAMAYNITQYQKRLRPSTKLMAMVKAFGYGTGSFEIANLLQFHKIDYLAVAYADEGVELRKAGISIPIMVMNVEENSYEALLQFHLEPVIYSFKTLKAIDHFLRDAGIPLMSVHIEIDTGMNRLGFRPEQAGELGRGLASGPFKVQTVFSHLAAGEEQQQDEFTRQQAIFFEDAAKQLEAALSYPFLRHLANTAAIVRFPLLQLDMVRLGIGLYGIDSASCDQIELKEVATLKSTIAQIRTVKRGETVGYNRKGVANENLSVATVRIGYADGFPRSLGNGAGKMWLKGRLAPTIGTVCMDMTMIDITGMPDVEEGDEVVLFGPQLSVQRVARWAQTIPYEMLTGISHRVKRIYFQD